MARTVGSWSRLTVGDASELSPDDSKVFTPYVRLPFDREALVKVVIGPVVKHHLAETPVRRFLDRYGFREAKIEVSQAPLQV